MATDTLRRVTGRLALPNGAPMPNVTLTWFRETRAVRAQGASVILDQPFRVQADASGAIDTELMAGRYLVLAPLTDADRYFRVSVPDTAGPWTIVDLLDAPEVPDDLLGDVQALVAEARAWAAHPEDIEVEPGAYSALHWAAQAGAAASGAAASEAVASLSETNAAAAETGAAGSAAAADARASDAAASAGAAAASEAGAGAAESGAGTARDAAVAARGAAGQSESAAAAAATAAGQSETGAAASAAAAASSESAAAGSRDAAASSAAAAAADAFGVSVVAAGDGPVAIGYDANAYITGGIYSIYGSITNWSNLPPGALVNNGFLEVKRHKYGSTYIRVLQTVYGTPNASGTGLEVWRRVGTGSDPVAWQSWERIDRPMRLHLQERKSSGAGGTFTSGAWRTRALNHVLTNAIPGCDLLLDVNGNYAVWLPAGRYRVDASAPAYRVGTHQARLYGYAAAGALALGTTEYSVDTSGVTSRSVVRGAFTLAAYGRVEIDHQCQLSQTTHGFGAATTSYGTNVFTDMRIERIGNA